MTAYQARNVPVNEHSRYEGQCHQGVEYEHKYLLEVVEVDFNQVGVVSVCCSKSWIARISFRILIISVRIATRSGEPGMGEDERLALRNSTLARKGFISGSGTGYNLFTS